MSRERLELLAVVRGLEALEQPSTVTLVTSSKQISRAVRQGLEYWRVRDWKWERFGDKVPMKNGDLWQRIDHALRIHDVRCRTFRIDRPHAGRSATTSLAGRRSGDDVPSRNVDSPSPKLRPLRPMIAVARWTARSMHRAADGLQRLLPDGSPSPHPQM